MSRNFAQSCEHRPSGRRRRTEPRQLHVCSASKGREAFHAAGIVQMPVRCISSPVPKASHQGVAHNQSSCHRAVSRFRVGLPLPHLTIAKVSRRLSRRLVLRATDTDFPATIESEHQLRSPVPCWGVVPWCAWLGRRALTKSLTLCCDVARGQVFKF